MPFIFTFIPFIFFLVFIIIIISSSKRKKININLNISSEYTKMAYDLIIKTPEVAEARKKYKKKQYLTILLIIILLGSFVFFFIHNPVLAFVSFILFAVSLFLLARKDDSKLFDEIVAKLLKKYDENFEYDHKSGIPSQVYREARFGSYDRYHSDDLIKGKINNNTFELAEVHTERRSTDSEGRTTYVTTFHGTFIKVDLEKSFDGYLNIVNNRIKLFSRDEYVTIDNEAFEKVYDVFTDDKIKALRLLTPDVTSKMIDIYNETGLYCEIKILGKFLYMRLFTGALFPFSFSNPEKESKLIGESVAVVDLAFKVIKNFVNELERFDV